MRTKTLKSTGTFQSQHTKLLQQTDQMLKTCIIFDFSLPWDTRINEKYVEKVSKYLPLASAMKYQMNLKSVTIQPNSQMSGQFLEPNEEQTSKPSY